MSEPTFIAEAQATDFNNSVELKAWAYRQREAAGAAGCAHFRWTHDPASVGHVLLEAWKEHPSELGNPRWGQANV